MTVIIVRAEIAFAETAYRCGSAVKKTFVDRNFGSFAGAAGCKRMDDASTRAKRDRRLSKPSLKATADGLICNHTGRERFWSKWKIVADAHRAANEFDVAAKRSRRHVDGVSDKKATGVDVGALTEIECVCESKGIYLIVALSQEEVRLDFRISDFHMANGKDERGLVIFRNFAAQLEASAQLKFCVTIVIEGEGVHFRRENKICVKEERVLIRNFASITALRDLDGCGHRAAVAEQIAIADLHTGKCRFVSVESDPKTKFLAFCLFCRDVKPQQMSIDGDRFDLKQVELASLHERPKPLV